MDKLIELYGGDQPTAQRQFAQRLASEIDSRGVLDVLRQGVRDRGVQIELAFFRPGHTGAVSQHRLRGSPGPRLAPPVCDSLRRHEALPILCWST